MLHEESDETAPVEQDRLFASRMQKDQDVHEYIEYEHNHGLLFHFEEYSQEALDWFEDHFII